MQIFLCCKFRNVPPCSLPQQRLQRRLNLVTQDGSRVFTFRVAHPQQLDFFFCLFSPLLLSFALPAPRLANRKTLQTVILSARRCAAASRRRMRPAVGCCCCCCFVSEALQRFACLHTSTFRRLSLPLLRLSKGGARARQPARRRSEAPQHRPNWFNIATSSWSKKKKRCTSFPAPPVTCALLAPPTVSRSFRAAA